MTVDNLAVLLRAREEELSAIYENVPGILFYIAVETDGEFRFLSVSCEFLVATGLTREDIVGSLVRDVIPPPSRDMVLHHYREAILSGQTVRWEEESLYPSGRRHGEVAVTPLYDAGGTVTHLIGIVHDITERKRLEVSQRENEERQAFLLGLSDALRSTTDPAARQTLACRMLGEHLQVNRVTYADIEGDEFITRDSWVKDVNPRIRRGPVSVFGNTRLEAFRRGEPIKSDDVVADQRFTEPERETFGALQIRAFVSIGFTKSGRWTGTFGVHSRTPRVWTNADVELIREVAERSWSAAERARAGEALRESEHRLRLVLDVSGGGSWTWDACGNRVDWDDRFRVLYGFTPEEPPAFDAWISRVHEEDRPQVLGLLDAILHSNTSDGWDSVFRVVRPDGTMAWIESLGRAQRNGDDQITRLIGLELDITERKRTEDALRSVSTEMQQTVHIEATGLNHCGRDLRYLSANPAYAESVGVPLHQIIGRPIVEVIGKAAFDTVRPRIERVLRGETVEYEDEVPYPGGNRWMRGAYTPDRDASGNVIGWVASIMDITDRKRMEEERAEEGRRKDEFLSFLGHELRNPLAAISTAVQVLSGGVTDEQRASLDGMINRQVKLMQRLLDDLLDLGRITHGYIQLKKERVDLLKFLQHVTEVTQSTTEERGQELILRPPSEVVTFKADEARLEQIATNLLGNASKYTAQGGRIELSGAREGSEVVLRFRDNGRGIPREMQQKIFEPFTRVEPFADSRGEASLGIGLALVKRLVELHGGTISVESGWPGMGSEFLVRLPLEPAPSDQPAVQEAKSESTSRNSRLIVVVEDNSDVGRAMVIALERTGYRVTLFADAFSALAGLSDLRPHAVLLDIGLPGMDGYRVAAELRGKQHLRDTLLIGLSGFGKRETTESGRFFDHYFTKPVNLSALLSLIDVPAPPAAGEFATACRASEKVEALRVLLIEDHSGLLEMTAAMLRSEGLEVRTALSGREGLEAAADFKPELTLCDLNLPDMNGKEVIRSLRSNPLTRHTYAVVLTAMSKGELREGNREAARMGIDEFMPKPLRSEAIATLLTNVKRQQIGG
jgi:PAS domain S-box-containing protein